MTSRASGEGGESGRQGRAAGTNGVYLHERTGHTGCTDTLRASVPNFSDSPRLVPRRLLHTCWRTPPASPSGTGGTSGESHRPMRPPESSAQPRARRHRPLPLCHSPDGCARGAPSRLQAAIGQKSTKTAFRKFFLLGGGTARPGGPGEPSNVAGGLRPGRLRAPQGPDALGAARLKSPAWEKG